MIKCFLPPEFSKMEISNQMRLAWEQHVYWTRMALLSIAHRLNDESDVITRLLQNPGDIAAIFAKFYNAGAVMAIEWLLTVHLQTGAQIITALRDGDVEQAARLQKNWFQNADQMASAFSSINPYYNQDELRDMLYQHLLLTTQEVAARLAGKYSIDIAVFGEIETEAMAMADNFTTGLCKQFPERFCPRPVPRR